MKFINQLGEYFYLKKRDPNAPHNRWLGRMHGINRISIFVFLLGLIIMLVKYLIKK
jgi:hypothetical protein